MKTNLKAALIAGAMTAVAAGFSALTAAPASAGEFTCEEGGFPYQHPDDEAVLEESGYNGALVNILKEYAQRWEGEQIRAACDAKMAGHEYIDGCFDGRRDWDAIKSMTPSEFFKMDRKALRPHQLQLQSEVVNPRGDAFDYCRSIGAM